MKTAAMYLIRIATIAYTFAYLSQVHHVEGLGKILVALTVIVWSLISYIEGLYEDE